MRPCAGDGGVAGSRIGGHPAPAVAGRQPAAGKGVLQRSLLRRRRRAGDAGEPRAGRAGQARRLGDPSLRGPERVGPLHRFHNRVGPDPVRAGCRGRVRIREWNVAGRRASQARVPGHGIAAVGVRRRSRLAAGSAVHGDHLAQRAAAIAGAEAGEHRRRRSGPRRGRRVGGRRTCRHGGRCQQAVTRLRRGGQSGGPRVPGDPPPVDGWHGDHEQGHRGEQDQPQPPAMRGDARAAARGGPANVTAHRLSRVIHSANLRCAAPRPTTLPTSRRWPAAAT